MKALNTMLEIRKAETTAKWLANSFRRTSCSTDTMVDEHGDMLLGHGAVNISASALLCSHAWRYGLMCQK